MTWWDSGIADVADAIRRAAGEAKVPDLHEEGTQFDTLDGSDTIEKLRIVSPPVCLWRSV